MTLAVNRIPLLLTLGLLAACQTTPSLEDDARHTRLARIVDVHVYTDAERREAAKTEPRSSRTSVGVGVGMGFGLGGGGYGGIMVGGPVGGGDSRDLPPLVSGGANRYTVQPLHTRERLEVNSYGNYRVGDCVKLFSGHPTEYDRLFDLKPGESCNGTAGPAKTQ
jgi:hypothetical protein